MSSSSCCGLLSALDALDALAAASSRAPVKRFHHHGSGGIGWEVEEGRSEVGLLLDRHITATIQTSAHQH